MYLYEKGKEYDIIRMVTVLSIYKFFCLLFQCLSLVFRLKLESAAVQYDWQSKYEQQKKLTNIQIPIEKKKLAKSKWMKSCFRPRSVERSHLFHLNKLKNESMMSKTWYLFVRFFVVIWKWKKERARTHCKEFGVFFFPFGGKS